MRRIGTHSDREVEPVDELLNGLVCGRAMSAFRQAYEGSDLSEAFTAAAESIDWTDPDLPVDR